MQEGRNKPEQLPIRIEVAKPEDWKAYRELKLLAITGKDSKMFGSTPKKVAQAKAKTEVEWKGDMSGNSKFIVLSWDGSNAVAMGGAFEKDEKGYWRVNAGYVRENFRGRGIQPKMIATRLLEIKKRGGKKVITGVEVSNKTSINNCRLLGFTTEDPPIIEALDGVQFCQMEIRDLNNAQVLKKINEVLNAE